MVSDGAVEGHDRCGPGPCENGWSRGVEWPPPCGRPVRHTGLWLGDTGMIAGGTLELFLIGLSALLIGTWAGLRLYGRPDQAGFRKVVLALLLVFRTGPDRS